MKTSILAILIVVGAVEASAKDLSRSPTGKPHPGPQPSVTIRDLPPPTATAGKEAVNAVKRRNAQHRELAARIKSARKAFADLKKEIASAGNDGIRRELQQRADALGKEIVRMLRDLRKEHRRPRKKRP